MNAVTDAILNVTTDQHVRMAMLLGAKLESGWNPASVGDGGNSFGPFQIYLVAHPEVTAAQARDPVWAANYMLQSYINGVSQIPSSLWSSDPAQAAATAAFYAERPAVMYAGYRDLWPDVLSVLSGNPGTTGGITPGGTPGGITASPASLLDFGPIIKPFEKLANYAYMALIIGASTGGILLGLYWLFKGSEKPSVPNLGLWSTTPREAVKNAPTRNRVTDRKPRAARVKPSPPTSGGNSSRAALPASTG